MKLLDTTFLIDLMKGKDECKKIVLNNQRCLSTCINMYELLIGVYYKNKKPNNHLEILELFENIHMLPLEISGIMNSAKISAELLKSGNQVSHTDCLIAGIALSHSINTIVTRNVKHFNRIPGIKVETY
tara:strand:+ start:10428 stop:10814 length:387 start_codon:yes stop_codon:yes gene_type:complete